MKQSQPEKIFFCKILPGQITTKTCRGNDVGQLRPNKVAKSIEHGIDLCLGNKESPLQERGVELGEV
jgi:hypothetical protein